MNRLPFRFAAAAALLCCLSTGGCQVAGVLAYKVMGPPAIPPRFVPTKEQPLLVMVENSHSTSGSVPEVDELANVLNIELTDNLYKDIKDKDRKERPVGYLVEPDKVHDLRAANPSAFARLSVSEIGKRVGAKQIIYVTLTELDFEQPPGSEMMRLKMAALVRVVDVDTADTLWPQTGNGEEFLHTSQYHRITAEMTESKLKREVLQQAGKEISRWFYPYKPETMSEENADWKLR